MKEVVSTYRCSCAHDGDDGGNVCDLEHRVGRALEEDHGDLVLPGDKVRRECCCVGSVAVVDSLSERGGKKGRA